MDNKLSELSKPVAYDYQIASACIADGNDKKWVDWNNEFTHECPPDWMIEDGRVTGIKSLYSQEYVSALLAGLEKKEKLLISNAIEYEISATDLLAELEAKDKRIDELERTNQSQNDHINQQQDRIESLEKKNVDLGRALGAAEKRIAELEQEPTIKHMRSVEEALISATDRASELEGKLATPVRLPNKNDDEFWFDGVFQVAKFDRAVERSISAAGFTFTVEGDE